MQINKLQHLKARHKYEIKKDVAKHSVNKGTYHNNGWVGFISSSEVFSEAVIKTRVFVAIEEKIKACRELFF